VLSTRPRTAPPAPGQGPLLFVCKCTRRASCTTTSAGMRRVIKSWAVPRGPSLNPSDKRFGGADRGPSLRLRLVRGRDSAQAVTALGEVIVWDCGVYTPDEGQEAALVLYHESVAEAERRIMERPRQGKAEHHAARREAQRLVCAACATWEIRRTGSSSKAQGPVSPRKRYHGERITRPLRPRSRGLKALPVRRMPASQLVPSGKKEALR